MHFAASDDAAFFRRKMKRRLFTSESVTEGHPDKVCDKISDSILDALLAQDANSRVALETCCNTGFALLSGEITSSATVDYEAIVRKTAVEIGYDDEAKGFDGATCEIETRIEKQSADIALGVDRSLECRDGGVDRYDAIGAGDQGMVFGYACDQTPQLMPAPISYAHALTARLAKARKTGVLPYLRPDGKAQVTVVYEDGRPVRIDTVVVSAQHTEDVDMKRLRRDVEECVIREALPAKMLDGARFLINPTGRFVVGGPHGDCGLTGRKIIVDTYGGYCPHGGGAFSGKDPTKVDRSACYMARYACKNVVAAGLAKECRLDVAYAIGVARPVQIQVNTFGTAAVDEEKIAELVAKHFDFRPQAIIETLGLRSPIFAATTNYGHFGREDQGFKWENTDKAQILADEA